MNQYVLVTGAGREMALGFNFVRRYLEQGDYVIATVRKPSEALDKLQQQYPDRLHIQQMELTSTESVNAAAEQVAAFAPRLDLVINNATSASPYVNKTFDQYDLDAILPAYDVAAVGPLRVIKAFLPLVKKAEGPALIVNISSEAGSIGACYRKDYLDYAMSKAALNMATKTLHNWLENDPDVNIICVHPGWVRTSPQNANATFGSYEQAETLRLLFERKRTDKTGPIFVTYTGEAYPW